MHMWLTHQHIQVPKEKLHEAIKTIELYTIFDELIGITNKYTCGVM